MNSYQFEISNRGESSSVLKKFHFGCISKWLDILMDMCRDFIAGSVCIFYHPKWNFISVKVTNMKSIPALSFKRTRILNATSNKSALTHFVLGKLCSHENLMPVWNFISVKMTDIKSSMDYDEIHTIWFYFASIHVNTSKELTEHWSEIFNRNEISYRFEFILPLMWTYS